MTILPPARAPDWAEGLPPEMLASILSLLPSFADHLHFAAVCSPWRSVAMHSRRRHRSPTPSPWVLLPRENPDDDRHSLLFLRPSDGIRLSIPLPYPGQPQCVGISPDGWLILDDEAEPRRLHAINPLTGGMLLLPSPAAVTEGTRMDPMVAYKVAMSTYPYGAGDSSLDVVDAGWPRSAVFAAVFAVDYLAPKSVALARAGDSRWEVLSMGHLKEVHDVTYHQGKFYILGHMKVVNDPDIGCRFLACVGVGVVDFSAGDPLSTAKVTVLPLQCEYSPPLLYHFGLVGSPSGDLLLAQMLWRYPRMRLFLVDLCATGSYLGGREGQKVVELRDLGGDRALLVGDLCSTAVSARQAPQLKGNCIYWISEEGRYPEMKVFSFDTVRYEIRRLPARIMLAWFVPGLL